LAFIFKITTGINVNTYHLLHLKQKPAITGFVSRALDLLSAKLLLHISLKIQLLIGRVTGTQFNLIQ
jgi:hypothetical protein